MIKAFSGTSNILLVAPHGYPGDDDYTGEITINLQKQLNCSAIINQEFRRTKRDEKRGDWPKGREPIDLKNHKVDLNFIPQVIEAGLKERWLDKIDELKEKILCNHKSCFVFLVHGAKDENVEEVDPKAKILIGIGLVGDDTKKKERCTVDEDTESRILRAFNEEASTRAVFARVGTDQQGHNYAAWDSSNLNQLFTPKHLEYNDPAVQSIQLEIKKTGFREKDSFEKTAEILSSALRYIAEKDVEIEAELMDEAIVTEKAVIPANKDNLATDLAEEAYDFVVKTLLEGAESTLRKIGKHIIDTFFEGNIDLAKKKDARVDNKPYSRLIDIIDSRKEIPFRRSSLFNAVNLVIQEHDFANVQAIGQLPSTQQILLLPVHDAKRKQRLAIEASERNYTTRQLAEAIKKSNPEPKETLLAYIKKPQELFSGDHENIFTQASLKALTPKERADLKKQIPMETEKIRGQIAKHRYYLEQYHALLDKIPETEEVKKESEKPKRKRSKNQDWIYDTVSCHIGCSNDCLYCFAKGDIVTKRCEGNKKNLKVVSLNDWPKAELSVTGLLDKYTLNPFPVMCPGTHDITEESFDNTLTMLQRLLEAGNRVLIVSKPRPKLIEKLCKELEKYRDNIIFRFTIGAMSDEILSFWEPNAPTYKERKEALSYVFKNKFWTSVSIEPMLDPKNIEALVSDLDVYVNHSIWIGIMNHFEYMDTDLTKTLEKITGKSKIAVKKREVAERRVKRNLEHYNKEEAAKLRQEIEKIEFFQKPDFLGEIYEKLKNNPLVRLKSHIIAAIKDEKGLSFPDGPEKWPEQQLEQVKVPGLDK